MGSAKCSAPRGLVTMTHGSEGVERRRSLCKESRSGAFVLDRAEGYFSADVLLTNVLCDDDDDRANKRQFLNTAPLWFPSAEICPEISILGHQFRRPRHHSSVLLFML